jgi:hypothetical protein
MVVEAARKLVDRGSFATLKTDEERVASLYLAVYQRPPSTHEIALALQFVKRNPAGTALDHPAADPKPSATAKDQRKETRQAQQSETPATGRFAAQVGGAVAGATPPMPGPSSRTRCSSPTRPSSISNRPAGSLGLRPGGLTGSPDA